MTQINISAEWWKLCGENAVARGEYFGTFFTVNKKLAAIGGGTSNANPTDNELSELKKKLKKWDDVRSRMSEFVKKHT